MYYWHAVFWVGNLKYSYHLWADSYDDAKVKIKLAYGTTISLEYLERVNNP